MPDNTREQIPTRTRVEDVRKAAGFTDHGWLTFLRLTHEQARRIVAESATLPSSYTVVEYWRKVQMHAELNQELEQQHLPTVSGATYHWRMSQALPPAIRQAKKTKAGIDIGPLQPVEFYGGREDPGSSQASTPSDRVVLPPIRDQPDLAKYLSPSSQLTGEHEFAEHDQTHQARDVSDGL